MSGGVDGMDAETVDAMFAAMVEDIDVSVEGPDRPNAVFTVVDDGTIAVTLPVPYREALVSLVDQLASVLDGTGSEAVAADLSKRLFPPVYDDPVDEAGFAVRSHERLREGRVGACQTFLDTAGATAITAEEADCWLRVLNDLRLVIARDVSDDEAMEAFYKQETPEAAILALCSYLLSDLIEAIAG